MTDSRWMCKSIMYTELRGKLFSHPTLLVSMPGPLGSPMPRTSVTKQVSSSHLRTDLSQHFFKHLLSTYGVPSTVVGTRMHKMELLTCLLVGKAERKHHTQSGQWMPERASIGVKELAVLLARWHLAPSPRVSIFKARGESFAAWNRQGSSLDKAKGQAQGSCNVWRYSFSFRFQRIHGATLSWFSHQAFTCSA
jgi:hypothetical protein